MKKVNKVVKVLLLVAVVAIVACAAWLKMGDSTSEASNYSSCYKCIKFDNTTLGWSNVYAYCWNSDGDVDVVKFDQSDANTFYGVLPANTYIKMLFKNTDGKDNWDKQTVDLDLPSGPCTFIFEPTTTSGKIEGDFKTDDYSYVTIYYKNNSIATPYVYYQVGNSKWTSDFGYKMTKSTKYEGYYEAKILVYNTDSVTCCFNNGNNSVAWDNNNTSNYKLDIDSCNNFYKIDNGVVTNIK